MHAVLNLQDPPIVRSPALGGFAPLLEEWYFEARVATLQTDPLLATKRPSLHAMLETTSDACKSPILHLKPCC